MELFFCKSKIHRGTITDANLNYMGSITISEDIIESANIYPYEKVQVLNINNGARFETYVISGERGKGIICVNGAAARLVQKGDKVIIISYCILNQQEILSFEPKIVFLDDENKIIKNLKDKSSNIC